MDKGWVSLQSSPHSWRFATWSNASITSFQLQAWKGIITVCSQHHGGLYILDKDGNMLQKCALKLKHGSLGQFNWPRICHSGFEGSILVVDPENRCLQVRTLTGEWGQVGLALPVFKPMCAVLHRKDLFIGQSAEPFRIYKYTWCKRDLQLTFHVL